MTSTSACQALPGEVADVAMSSAGAEPAWTMLVPVKATSRGKSRLDLPADLRRRLALAMAMDTVSAAAACGDVLVVVEDSDDAATLGALPGVRTHLTRVTGLNESIRDGLRVLREPGRFGSGRAVAVLPGDLPGLRADDLAAALRLCSTTGFSVVPDRQDVGSTLLAATDLSLLEPLFGPDSFRRHQRAGARAIDLPSSSSLRHDVDVVADLRSAAGRFTTTVLSDPALAGITAGHSSR